ncbi:MAG: non-heme iron oxygenase ferredoxin subunit [Bacillota bacterium]
MSRFVKVAELSQVTVDGCHRVNVEGLRIALFHVGGTIYAIDDTCTHAEASLTEGELDGHEVICPRHGARFDVRTGRALTLPAVVPVETYPVRVDGQDVLVDLEA